MSKLNDMKRRHNELMEKGHELYAEMSKICDEVRTLRIEIEEIEGEDFDPIPLIFGHGLHIHPEDEQGEGGL